MKRKRCKDCERSRLVKFFSKHPRTRDRLQPRCKDCQRAMSKKHYEDNKQEYVDRAAAWAKANPEKAKAQSKKQQQKFRRKNRAYYLKRHADYKKVNRGQFTEYENRRRARKRGTEVEPIDRRAVYDRDEGLCHLCGDHVNYEDMHMDHVIPLSREGTHTYDNVAVACEPCNRKKWAKVA